MDWSLFWKGYVVGIAILLVAIILNSLASKLGILTWYGLIMDISKRGIIGAIKNTRFLSLFFMFVIYPFTLGIVAFFTWQKLI